MSNQVKSLLVFLLCLLLSQAVYAELLDDFGGPQRGTWAPVRWWYGPDAACRGKFVLDGNQAPMLDLAFSRAQRLAEITTAGGFIVEVEVLEIRGQAGVCIGSRDYKEKGIAVVVNNENSSESDKLYVNGKAYELTGNYIEGKKLRIEIAMKDFDRESDCFISVYFGDQRVIEDLKFHWQKSPLGFFLSAIGSRAVFDNLLIDIAQPSVEFTGWQYAQMISNNAININVAIENAERDWDYTVDCVVTGGTAVQGVDYFFEDQKVSFPEGQTTEVLEVKFPTGKKPQADKTIELALVNPKGGNLRLGGEKTFSYSIEGKYPTVQFAQQQVTVNETSGSGKVQVVLSHGCDEAVTVGYEVVGGSADNGRDYRLKKGKVTFKPDETVKDIHITVLDDKQAENSIDETVMVQLVNPVNSALGKTNVVELGITDDEPWIEFDGAYWICSYDKHKKVKGRNVLAINDKGQLEWACSYGDMLYAKLTPQSISRVGQSAQYGWLYKGDGQATGSYVENICERYGSGDLRLAMLDLNGKTMSLDKQYTRNDEVFCGSKGYQARLSPHVPINQRADKWATRVNPSGDNCHSPVDWGGCWGFPTYFNGHGVTVGEFTPMIVNLTKTAEDTIEFSVTMNGQKHTMVDKDKSPYASNKEKMESLYGEGSYNVQVVEGYQPKQIDTMAFYFANQRPFDLITLAPMDE
jgi:hypothetical protein